MRWVTLVLTILVVIGGGFAVGFTHLNWFLIYILIGAFLLILASSAMWFSWPEPWHPILFGLGALLLVGIPGLSGLHPLVAPILVLVAWAIYLILYIIAKLRQGNLHGYVLGDHWHITKKGLGGSIFGDVANMVGVLAGVGAYRLVSGNPQLTRSWWWIGQMGAYMAAVVGLSLFWRWAISNPGSGEGKQKWPALFNWMVAAGTILSLYSPTSSNFPLSGITEQTDPSLACGQGCLVVQNDNLGVGAGWTWIAALIILVIMAIVVFCVGIKRRRFTSAGDGILVMIIFILITIATIITIVFAIIGGRNQADWTNFGAVIGMLAVLSWVCAEGYNYIKVTAEWRENSTYISVLDYMDWEKNLWEIIGGLGTILFVAGNTWRSDWSATNDAMFYVAASLGFLGTLRGLFRGVTKQLYTDDYTTRVNAQLGQVQSIAAKRQQLFFNASQQSAQRRGVIQARDATILQRDTTIAQRDAAINDLQLQIADKDSEISMIRTRLGKTEQVLADLDKEEKRKSQRIQEMNAELQESASQLRREQQGKQAEIDALRREIEELRTAVAATR